MQFRNRKVLSYKFEIIMEEKVLEVFKYVFEDDYAYVYTNVGISRPMSEEKFDIYNDIVSKYDDIDNGNVLAYKTVDKFKDSFITIDNHTEFKEYIFVFKKNSNGNYYFVNVKKS